MLLRLAPHVPSVWRSPTELQFGVERVLARLGPLSPEEERMVAALAAGTSRGGLEVLASGDAASARAAVDRLLAALDPVLERPEARQPGPGRVLVVGSGPVAGALVTALGPAQQPVEHPDLVVLVTPWVVSPADAGTWLRRDVPHLPVVLADGIVGIGPLVRPGTAPCLWCVHRERADLDPAWPAIAAQLLDRPAPTLDPLARAQVVAVAGRMARSALDAPARETGEPGVEPGVELVLRTADGAVSRRRWSGHADCRCAAPSGSGWGSGADRASPAPTS